MLRRVIASDIVAEEGHDIAPHYLPDGRIVFSSTRQRQSKAVLIDEGKPQFAAQDEDQNEHAFVLHVMNADGSGIRQISFNQSHDLDPDVLDDVMHTLEGLREGGRTVGIVSHVTELKSRVADRIEVLVKPDRTSTLRITA